MANLINPKIKFTTASELRMDQAINMVGITLRKSLKSTLQKTSVFFVQSAAKLTPQSKPKRKFRAISPTKERILYGAGVRYRVRKYSGLLNKFYWVYAKNDAEKTEKALIKNRGLYKKIWYEMLPKLGRVNNRSYSDTKTNAFAKRSVRVINKSWLKEDPFVLLTYRRGELRKIAPGVIPHALNKAKKRLVGDMNNQVKRKMERAWTKK